MTLFLEFLTIILATWAATAFAQSRALGEHGEISSLNNASIEDIARGLDNGCFTSLDLVRTYISRINDVNEQFHAVTEINPEAEDIAISLDNERKASGRKSPLHGIPILLTNTIATHDKMNNTAGSYALLGTTVPRDSGVARRLREAGAIILGKANLSQWSNLRSTKSPDGWSAHGGQVKAAYHEDQDPSGCSSGSCVAADLGLAAASIGTDTEGGLLWPAERSNVVGLKPTRGLVSRDLTIPVSMRYDTIGPIGRSVRDVAYVLQAIAGKDPKDLDTLDIPSIPNYVDACETTRIKSARIGVPWDVILSKVAQQQLGGPLFPKELKAFNESLRLLEQSGAEIVDTTFPAHEEILNSKLMMFYEDFPDDLARYLQSLSSNPQHINTLMDLKSFTQQNEFEKGKEYGTQLWDALLDPAMRSRDGQPFNETLSQVRDAFEVLGKKGGLMGALERDQLTAVALPTRLSPTFATIHGAPVITVPSGHFPEDTAVVRLERGNLVHIGPGVPIGISFLGQRWSEADLLGIAYALEQGKGFRGQVKQKVLPKTDLKVQC